MAPSTPTELKSQVRSYWETETCGTRYGDMSSRQAYFDEISAARYALEPYILPFANFPSAEGKRVLEIGVGAGSDFYQWLHAGATATGVDLTDAAIDLTRERLELAGIEPTQYQLQGADAEALPFDADQFDLVYSWGVLHHTPNTALAFQNAFRVLKRGGTLKAMIYHAPSWTGWLLWLQYALLRGRWMTPRQAVFDHLESPGTKAYTKSETQHMLTEIGFEQIDLQIHLGTGDLLLMKPSTKYQHPLYKIIWALYPRWLVRLSGDRFGLCLLISAKKP